MMRMDPGAAQALEEFRNHTGAILDAQFSTDGRYLATACSDHTCKLWNTSTFLRSMEKIKLEREVGQRGY